MRPAILHDPVNRPSHYTAGAVECIDAIHAALGDALFVGYCRGAALKYTWRTGAKDDAEQDLRKGAWYLLKAADVLAAMKAKDAERTARAVLSHKDADPTARITIPRPVHESDVVALPWCARATIGETAVFRMHEL